MTHDKNLGGVFKFLQCQLRESAVTSLEVA